MKKQYQYKITGDIKILDLFSNKQYKQFDMFHNIDCKHNVSVISECPTLLRSMKDTIANKIITFSTKLRHCTIENKLYADCCIESNNIFSKEELKRLVDVICYEWNTMNKTFEYDYSECFQIVFLHTNQKINIQLNDEELKLKSWIKNEIQD